MQLVDINTRRGADVFLYGLLRERTPAQSISHKAMPTFEEHQRFMRCAPYRDWAIIVEDELDPWENVGAIYVTRRYEVGIHIARRYRREHYGASALKLMRAKFHDRPLLANINPANAESLRFFASQGARILQYTFIIE